jgi:hypothetical protein
MQTIKNQFKTMLESNIIPVFEFEIINDDYLVVDIYLDNKGIGFEFDDQNLPVSFDGEIEKRGDTWLLPFDPFFEDLDHYLQMISENITEGFLLPNSLDRVVSEE